ncbi:acyl carrier protein [Streptacidiphilus pinicola]|uniref:Acyl carrier protein n=1 Tax=Streptacidiphilus pinicola TaxID=2219663 RepID=A0A2X0KJG4_9ACTN|nr:phosphopantetheine-binding protein [Streptacidiphilus pinicola]RAG87119.1 acyl carrier protein [Streptacidiphilus pinicola]
MTVQTTGSRPATQQEMEQWVADSWRALGLTVAGPATDFFSVGGTSLAAARFLAGAEELFGEDVLPPEDFFEGSSVEAVAALIVRNSSGES